MLITQKQINWSGHINGMNPERITSVIFAIIEEKKKRKVNEKLDTSNIRYYSKKRKTVEEMKSLSRDRITWKEYVKGGSKPKSDTLKA